MHIRVCPQVPRASIFLILWNKVLLIHYPLKSVSWRAVSICTHSHLELYSLLLFSPPSWTNAAMIWRKKQNHRSIYKDKKL